MTKVNAEKFVRETTAAKQGVSTCDGLVVKYPIKESNFAPPTTQGNVRSDGETMSIIGLAIQSTPKSQEAQNRRGIQLLETRIYEGNPGIGKILCQIGN